jgi:hypothetical protein
VLIAWYFWIGVADRSGLTASGAMIQGAPGSPFSL